MAFWKPKKTRQIRYFVIEIIDLASLLNTKQLSYDIPQENIILSIKHLFENKGGSG